MQEPDVRELFSPYGVVQDVSFIKDRATGESKGLLRPRRHHICPTTIPRILTLLASTL
jgi:hypothetical protein